MAWTSEPTLMGLKCTGGDENRVNTFLEQAEAAKLAADFYRLTADKQRILAAAVTQMLKNSLETDA